MNRNVVSRESPCEGALRSVSDVEAFVDASWWLISVVKAVVAAEMPRSVNWIGLDVWKEVACNDFPDFLVVWFEAW